MSGNVSEWTWDSYEFDTTKLDRVDPQGNEDSSTKLHEVALGWYLQLASA